MATKRKTFKIGRVRGYLRGRIWYLYYYENGARRRPRVGPDRDAAKRLAAEVNAQLEAGAPSTLDFERVGIVELRDRWLQRHEHVARSSLQTIRRYRAATDHLLRFSEGRPFAIDVSRLSLAGAEEFAAYLRSVLVSPNGHHRTAKRTLRDKGVVFVLATCRAFYNYATAHRHLSPYADNPFAKLSIDRIPVEDAKPIRLLIPDEERRFFEACDEWQFPVFLTLALTGCRPGEITHLLLPHNVDLNEGLLHVRNKPLLGWRVKTRNERDVPLHPALVSVLRTVVGERSAGPVFRIRRPTPGITDMESRLAALVDASEPAASVGVDREARARLARRVWREAGAITNERLRRELIRVARKAGINDLTTPKTFRHMFATTLQDANVDPVIRMELMGHSTKSVSGSVLGSTAGYTHTRPETRRRQLMAALDERFCVAVAEARLAVINVAAQVS